MFYWLDKEKYLNILVKVKPNAKKTEINKIYEVESIYPVKKALQINLKTAPIEGRANYELIKFLSKYLSINKSQIEIISGQKARLKLIKINGRKEEIIKALNA